MVVLVGFIVFVVLVVMRLTVLTFKVRSQTREIATYKIEKQESEQLVMKLNHKIDHLKVILNHGKKGETKKGQAEKEGDDGQH